MDLSDNICLTFPDHSKEASAYKLCVWNTVLYTKKSSRNRVLSVSISLNFNTLILSNTCCINPTDESWWIRIFVNFQDADIILRLDTLTVVTSLERHGVSNYRQLSYFFNSLFGQITKKTWKIRIPFVIVPYKHRMFTSKLIMCSPWVSYPYTVLPMHCRCHQTN